MYMYIYISFFLFFHYGQQYVWSSFLSHCQLQSNSPQYWKRFCLESILIIVTVRIYQDLVNWLIVWIWWVQEKGRLCLLIWKWWTNWAGGRGFMRRPTGSPNLAATGAAVVRNGERLLWALGMGFYFDDQLNQSTFSCFQSLVLFFSVCFCFSDLSQYPSTVWVLECSCVWHNRESCFKFAPDCVWNISTSFFLGFIISWNKVKSD